MTLRAELHQKSKEVGKVMLGLIERIIESYGVTPDKITLRVRSAKTSYYKPNQINLTFVSDITTILHEVKHHLDFVEAGGVMPKTYKKLFENELFTSAFACMEFEKWLDPYVEEVLPVQVQYIELLDRYKRGER